MRVLLTFAVALLAVPDRPDPTPKEAVRPLQEQIQGEWQVMAATMNGQPNRIIMPGQAVFRFEGNKMTLRRTQVATESRYQFSVDSTKPTATFDFSMSKITKKPLAGIIKLEGDTLTICYYFSRQPGRPTKFVSAPGSNAALWQLKRMKK